MFGALRRLILDLQAPQMLLGPAKSVLLSSEAGILSADATVCAHHLDPGDRLARSDEEAPRRPSRAGYALCARRARPLARAIASIFAPAGFGDRATGRLHSRTQSPLCSAQESPVTTESDLALYQRHNIESPAATTGHERVAAERLALMQCASPTRVNPRSAAIYTACSGTAKRIMMGVIPPYSARWYASGSGVLADRSQERAGLHRVQSCTVIELKLWELLIWVLREYDSTRSAPSRESWISSGFLRRARVSRAV